MKSPFARSVRSQERKTHLSTGTFINAVPLDGTFDKIINWAIMNEKAHLYSPSFGARAECNTNKAKGALGSHGTARTGALGHSRVLWATAQLGMH